MRVALLHYEGLINATARRCVAFCEEDFEDVAQVLRVKAWQALRSYDPLKSRTTRDKYVFMCVRDRAKDVVKKKKRGEVAIEDQRDDSGRGSTDYFDERYLCSTREQNYGLIEDDDDPMAALDDIERAIAQMLTEDYKQAQIVLALGLSRLEMERAMKSIRFKLDHLRVEQPEPDPAPIIHHVRRRRGTVLHRQAA